MRVAVLSACAVAVGAAGAWAVVGVAAVAGGIVGIGVAAGAAVAGCRVAAGALVDVGAGVAPQPAAPAAPAAPARSGTGTDADPIRYERIDRADPNRAALRRAQLYQFEQDAKAGKVLCLSDLMISAGM